MIKVLRYQTPVPTVSRRMAALAFCMSCFGTLAAFIGLTGQHGISDQHAFIGLLAVPPVHAGLYLASLLLFPRVLARDGLRLGRLSLLLGAFSASVAIALYRPCVALLLHACNRLQLGRLWIAEALVFTVGPLFLLGTLTALGVSTLVIHLCLRRGWLAVAQPSSIS